MISTAMSLLAAGALLTNCVEAACSAYTVDTQGAIYQFNHYSFLDFRNQNADFTSSPAFTDAYSPQSWGHNSPSNVAMATDSINGAPTSMLRMTSAMDSAGQLSIAEIDSTASDFYYASVRIGARVTGAAGACAGLFFYHNDTQEVDIEILTREQNAHLDADTNQPAPATTSQIHLTNQPHLTQESSITLLADTIHAEAITRGSNTTGSWETFNNYRIDWIPGASKWWQNGLMTHTADQNLLVSPSSWIFNIWSNGDPSWSGTMQPGTAANLDILWVEMAYNTFSEGAPSVVTAPASAGCALGVGDGSDLQNPAAKTTAELLGLIIQDRGASGSGSQSHSPSPKSSSTATAPSSAAIAPIAPSPTLPAGPPAVTMVAAEVETADGPTLLGREASSYQKVPSSSGKSAKKFNA